MIFLTIIIFHKLNYKIILCAAYHTLAVHIILSVMRSLDAQPRFTFMKISIALYIMCKYKLQQMVIRCEKIKSLSGRAVHVHQQKTLSLLNSLTVLRASIGCVGTQN